MFWLILLYINFFNFRPYRPNVKQFLILWQKYLQIHNIDTRQEVECDFFAKLVKRSTLRRSLGPLRLLMALQKVYFFRLFFLDPPPFFTGWQASPCTCNGLWLLSCMAVFLKENNFFVTDQTPRPIAKGL
jgi:hypothetical protein